MSTRATHLIAFAAYVVAFFTFGIAAGVVLGMNWKDVRPTYGCFEP